MKYACGYCLELLEREDMRMPCDPENIKWSRHNKCKFCTYDEYFLNLAKCNILNTYKLGANEAPQDLIEVEILRAKIRHCIRGGDQKYITTKPYGYANTSDKFSGNEEGFKRKFGSHFN